MAYYRGISTTFWTPYSTTYISQTLQDLHGAYKAGTLERLEPAQCLNQYATAIQSNRRHVLLVASDASFPTLEQNRFINGSHVYWASPFYAASAQNSEDAANAYNWICSGVNKTGSCSNVINEIQPAQGTWEVGTYCPDDPYQTCTAGPFPIEYCLSQRAEPHCRLQFDTTIAIVVTVLNFGKLFLSETLQAQSRVRYTPSRKYATGDGTSIREITWLLQNGLAVK